MDSRRAASSAARASGPSQRVQVSQGHEWWEMDRRFGAASVVMQAPEELSHKVTLSLCVHSNPRLRSGALGSKQKDKVVSTGGCNQAGFELGLSFRDQRSSDIRRKLGAL